MALRVAPGCSLINGIHHVSKGPCRPGFSQSFYSVLISRDVMQGQGILKGKPVILHAVRTHPHDTAAGERRCVCGFFRLMKRCSQN
uniref:Uncharacterized protein n=1 Tax=Salarias fasciatus TaxID=181472 RepID=A0A672J948_SALFA